MTTENIKDKRKQNLEKSKEEMKKLIKKATKGEIISQYEEGYFDYRFNIKIEDMTNATKMRYTQQEKCNQLMCVVLKEVFGDIIEYTSLDVRYAPQNPLISSEFDWNCNRLEISFLFKED